MPIYQRNTSAAGIAYFTNPIQNIMINKSIFILCLLFAVSRIFSQTYITNVTIADVEHQKYIAGQTVEITGDKISGIQPATNAKIPANATIIDGSGKYLLPGLVDAHIHFSQSGGLYTRPDAIDLRKIRPYGLEIDWVHKHMDETLRRYLQNGITCVIDVGTTNNFLKQRASFASSTNSPSIYMAGPLLTTYEPPALSNLGDDGPFNLATSVEQAKDLVRAQLIYHPDFIKIWYIVGRDTNLIEANARKHLPIVKAIIDEAHKNKTKVAIHATDRITAQLSVENGCDYLVHSVDNEILSDEFVQLLKKHGTILCPTLFVHDGYGNTFGQRLTMTEHEIKMSDPFQLGSLLDMKHLQDTTLSNRYKAASSTPERIASDRTHKSNMMANLKKLSDAGVIIATGTDAGNIGTLHASSYLPEIKAMQASGMSNWQILQASTINGAKVLDREREFGSIAKGKLANMVLLDADPITAIENITQINLVINKGAVIDPDTLIKETPENLVQRQLNAYNFRNIDAFVDTYAEDVEIYEHPDKLLMKGKEAIRKNYGARFATTPELHCEILERTVKGNVVIDTESVQYENGGQKVIANVTYHIENGKIQKVYLLR